MARRTDKTGKTEAGQLPAEIYKFPHSGSASHAGAEQGARPPNLSSTEQREIEPTSLKTFFTALFDSDGAQLWHSGVKPTYGPPDEWQMRHAFRFLAG
jgi:hypothetical protein